MSTQQSVEPVLFRVREVATMTGQSVRQIWREIAAGRLQAMRLGAKSVRITKAAVDAYLSSLEPVR